MIRLGVNIDHVATVRQARRGAEPDPVFAAVLAQLGGADGITVHLREDRRHIQERDVRLLRQLANVRLNLEMAVVDAILEIALEVHPDEVTLVPEKREEVTTEGGLDVLAHRATVGPCIERLRQAGIHVSLFIDPERDQVLCSRDLGADAIEFQTASYSETRSAEALATEFQRLRKACTVAVEHNLHVHLGHGLNYSNTPPVCTLPGVEELNIGHSIVSRAVFVGFERAVREMKELIFRSVPV